MKNPQKRKEVLLSMRKVLFAVQSLASAAGAKGEISIDEMTEIQNAIGKVANDLLTRSEVGF